MNAQAHLHVHACVCLYIRHTDRGSRKSGRETERIGERLILKKVTTKKG